MAEQGGSAVLTAALVLVGVAAIGGLAWWAMAGSPRPVAVPPALPGADAAPAPADEDGLRALLAQPAVVARGQAVFNGLCFTCHGSHGEGGLGPNLRDDSWIAGSQMRDLVQIISDGKPGTAMQPMRYTYPAADIAAVAAYVVTLQGGSAGVDKAPEGEHRPITYWPTTARP